MSQTKTAVKRRAPPTSDAFQQASQKRKVLKTNNPSSAGLKKSAPAKRSRSEKPVVQVRRKAPVTVTATEDDEGEVSDASDGWDEEEADDDDDMEVDGNVRPIHAQSADLGNAGGGKSAQESHRIQKQLQKERQAAKPNASVLAEVKGLWSSARQKSSNKDERAKAVSALANALRGKVQDVVFKHDASRVIQTVLKYGSAEDREIVASELRGRYKELAQSKYGKFLVPKLLRYAPNQRSSIVSEFLGSVLKLLLHKEASPIIADMYELYASAKDRDLMLRDFYGKEVGLFYKELPEDARGLRDILKASSPDSKPRVLSALKENLTSMFNNPDKGAVSHAIVHRALWEYLDYLGHDVDEAEADRLRREMLESCQELVAEMVHTKEGSRAVREFLAQGNAKDRKQIVKTIKPHIQRMCKDEEAQLVLFTAMDVIDDTKLVGKSVVSEITAHASELAFDGHKHGRRALLYLLVPRSSKHFTPAIVRLLAETDTARDRTSKKDASVRQAEIRSAGSGPLLDLLKTKEQADALMRDPGASLLSIEILLHADGDRSIPIHTLCDLLARAYPTPVPSNGELMHLIDVPHSSRLIKTLVQGGQFSKVSGQIETCPSWPASEFCSEFVQKVPQDSIVRMASDGGAFILAELINRAVQDEAPTERRSELKQIFNQKAVTSIRKASPRGVDVLLESIGKL